MVTLFNLTPHTINLATLTHGVVHIPTIRVEYEGGSFAAIARLDTTSVSQEASIDDIDLLIWTTGYKTPYIGLFVNLNDKEPAHKLSIGLFLHKCCEGLRPKYLIVSRMFQDFPTVREEAQFHHIRFLSPGEAIRDDEGKIIGCNGLSS